MAGRQTGPSIAVGAELQQARIPSDGYEGGKQRRSVRVVTGKTGNTLLPCMECVPVDVCLAPGGSEPEAGPDRDSAVRGICVRIEIMAAEAEFIPAGDAEGAACFVRSSKDIRKLGTVGASQA